MTDVQLLSFRASALLGMAGHLPLLPFFFLIVPQCPILCFEFPINRKVVEELEQNMPNWDIISS